MSVVNLILGGVVLFVAVAWLLLPVIVLSKANELLKVLRAMRADIAAMRKYYEPEQPAAAPAIVSAPATQKIAGDPVERALRSRAR